LRPCFVVEVTTEADGWYRASVSGPVPGHAAGETTTDRIGEPHLGLIRAVAIAHAQGDALDHLAELARTGQELPPAVRKLFEVVRG